MGEMLSGKRVALLANPDLLRTDADAVRFVRSFFDAGKPVAAINHGPWTMVQADVARGPKLTSWPSEAMEEICEGRHDEQAQQTAGADS